MPPRTRPIAAVRPLAVVWLMLVGVGASAAAAAPAPAASFGDSATTISESGQFVVTGPRSATRRPMETRRPGETMRELTPQTLAVSCERVKDAVLEALDEKDQWRNGGGRTGKIFVGIDPLLRTNRSLTVEASVFEKGWQFRVALPARLTEDRLVRVITQAVTMELASRSGTARLGEPPLWWVEGITQIVLAAAPEGVILQPETRGTLDVRAGAGLNRLREQLSRDPPMAFHELSQPDLDAMDLRGWERYAASAQFCCHELLRQPEGRARLVRWLGSLQEHWNWQTGFIEAFRPQFRSLLDVEKWWALAVANFTGRNLSSTWTTPFALRKLDEALHPAGIVPGSGARVVRLPVEDVLLTWDFSRQVPLIRQLLKQLQAIRVNAPPKVASLVYRYSEVLDGYVEARSRAGYAPTGRGQAPGSAKLILREAVGNLRELEGQRTRLASEPEPPPRSDAGLAGS